MISAHINVKMSCKRSGSIYVGKGRELGAEALRWVGSGLDIVVRDAIKGLPVWDERAVGFYGVSFSAFGDVLSKFLSLGVRH